MESPLKWRVLVYSCEEKEKVFNKWSTSSSECSEMFISVTMTWPKMLWSVSGWRSNVLTIIIMTHCVWSEEQWEHCSSSTLITSGDWSVALSQSLHCWRPWSLIISVSWSQVGVISTLSGISHVERGQSSQCSLIIMLEVSNDPPLPESQT